MASSGIIHGVICSNSDLTGLDSIGHVLKYLHQSFNNSFITELSEALCLNKDALRMYHQDRLLFVKLAKQCSIISQQDPSLFEKVGHVKFEDVSSQRAEEIKMKMLKDALKRQKYV